MNFVIIFTTLVFIAPFVTFFQYRNEAEVSKTQKKRINNLILLVLLFSISVNATLLTITVYTQSKLTITILSWYVFILIISLCIFLFNNHRLKIQTFFYDLKCAASEIIEGSSDTIKKESANYTKREEITELLNEVVETVNNNYKDQETECNIIENNSEKNDFVNDKAIETSTIKKETNSKFYDEKEEKRKNKNPEYAKEQEDIEEILAFLAKKGL